MRAFSQLSLLVALCFSAFACTPTTAEPPSVLAFEDLKPEGVDQRIADDKHDQKILGKCTKAGLLQPPFDDKFDIENCDYQLDSDLLRRCKNKLDGVSFDVFLGTWCGDSQKEIPRLLKIFDALAVNDDSVTMTAIDYEAERYKQSPFGAATKARIHRVPTVIVRRDGKEIGRIVESPVTSLEMDLTQILNDLPSNPKYSLVPRVWEELSRKAPREFIDEVELLAEQSEGIARNDSELLTLVRIFEGLGETKKALATGVLNEELFPNSAKTKAAVAKSYHQLGIHRLAIQYAAEAVKMNPALAEEFETLDE